jgi:GTP-binding protein
VGREFSVVDTGGWVVNSDDIFEEEIRKQVLMAVDEADVILFVVDVVNGVTDLDQQVASILRRAKRPIILVANKTDNNDLQYNAAEFYSLGLGDPNCISAMSGSGTGDLMDLIVSKFKKETDEIIEEDIPRFAVVGRPNAGKSSIVNAFIGEDRNIVTDIAGTTRDSIYTRFNKFNFDFYLVDTAGIRKKNKINEDLEYYSVVRSIRSIENSDVCILMVDATRGIEGQDLNIFSLIQKNQKGLVVVVNKWDLVEDKTTKVMKTFEEAIRNRFAPFVDFPIIFASALTKQRILKVLEEANNVYQSRQMKISTARLNEEMLPLIEAYPPPSTKGKYIKIKYVTQLPNTKVPSFVFFANLPQYVKEPYKRFLENKLREKWNLKGTPINIYIRQK